MPERRERPTICGYRIVSEMACNDLLQPVNLIWDSPVHSQHRSGLRGDPCSSMTKSSPSPEVEGRWVVGADSDRRYGSNQTAVGAADLECLHEPRQY